MITRLKKLKTINSKEEVMQYGKQIHEKVGADGKLSGTITTFAKGIPTSQREYYRHSVVITDKSQLFEKFLECVEHVREVKAMDAEFRMFAVNGEITRIVYESSKPS